LKACHIELVGIVHNGLSVRQGKAQAVGHLADTEAVLGILQRPRFVRDLADTDAPALAAECKQAVSLGEEVFEAAGLGKRQSERA